jgi:hypothetical protein
MPQDPTPKRPAPAPSRAFPANAELKGRLRSDPPPRSPRPTVKNVFNVDARGNRPAMQPRKVG